MLRFILTPVLGMLASAVWAQTEPPASAPLRFPFEQSNAIVKYDCTMVQVEPDGKSTMLQHYRIAVLSDRAIRQYGIDNTVYNLGYDTVEVVAARVHLPGGKMVELDTSAIKDVPMPAFGKFFLQNVREKIITFPELQKGSEIEVMLRQITREAPMENEYDHSEYFTGSDPIVDKYLAISMPDSMILHSKEYSGDVPFTTSSENGVTRYVWSASNIPQFVPEPGMPPPPEVIPRVQTTTVKDWKTWSRWYYNLSDSSMVADDDIRAMVKQLTSGKQTSDEKLRAIFNYVSNNIRYVETALTGKKAGYKPEPAPVTFRNKYGVCRDKAALMVTMLREAGISSDITLMNPVWKIDDFPVDQFNHAVVAVHVGDSTFFVDPTAEKTADYMPANEQDRAVLICDKKGEDLAWTPTEPSSKNLYQIEAKSTLDDKGKYQSDVTISARGLPDLALRNFLQSMPPEERVNVFKRILQDISPTVILDTISFTPFMDLSQPVQIRLSFTATNYSIPAGKYTLFQMPEQAGTLDLVVNGLLHGSELTKRRYDLRLASTFAVRGEETVTYPKDLKVRSLPETVDMNFGDFRLARDFESKGNSLRVRRVLDFSTLDIPLDRYQELQELLQKSQAMSRGQVVLTKG
jgi:hypothetical protein